MIAFDHELFFSNHLHLKVSVKYESVFQLVKAVVAANRHISYDNTQDQRFLDPPWVFTVRANFSDGEVAHPALLRLQATLRMNAPSLEFMGTDRGHLAFSWTGGRMTVLKRRGRVWNS